MRRRPVRNHRVASPPRRRGWLRGIAAVLFGAAVTVGAVEGTKWARQSEVFAIAAVEVIGAERSEAEALVRLSGIEAGTNLFRVDLDAARIRVAGHPWVARADVRLTAMDHVVVTVVEHRPVALVALGNLYYVDAAAHIFKRYTPGEDVALPVVTGLDRARVEAGDPQQTDLLRAALGLVEAWDTLSYGVLAEVNVHEAGGLTAVLAPDGLTVALGQDGWRERLPRLAKVRSALLARGLQAHRIDLSGRRRADRAVVQLAPDVVGGDA